MRRARLLLSLLPLFVLLPGCGGDDEPARGGVAGVAVELSPSARAAAWASEAEVRWLRKVAEWNAAVAEAGSAVARFESGVRFDDVVRGDRRAVGEYARVLDPIRRCGRSFAAVVGEAPTRRLAEPARNFRESCAHYRRGVDLMLRAVREGDEELAERARVAIERAGKEAAIAAGTLPPGEKQPLPVGRDGRRSRVEPTFSEAASLVADKEVEARCWAPADWARLMVEETAYTRGKVDATALGFASAGGDRLNLAPQVCHGLTGLAYRDERPAERRQAFALALAVATLAHESVHASGVADEPAAECHGIQWLERTARAIGVEARYAARLEDVYWSRYGRLPAMYRSPDCRDGGPLDLDDSSTEFP